MTFAPEITFDRKDLWAALRKSKVNWLDWNDASTVAELLKDDDPRAADNLVKCSDPDSGFFETCTKDPGHHARFIPERCHLRICPNCARYAAGQLRDRYRGRVEKVTSRFVWGWSLKKLELTMKREGDLSDQIKLIHRSTKKLVKHFWTRQDKRAGAFATLELGPKGGNIHVHVIVYGGWVSHEYISDYWRKLTDNYVVWVKRIHTTDQAITEGIKYATKSIGDEGHTLDPKDLAELHLALKGKRRVWAWGAFYGVVDDVDDGEDDFDDICPECGSDLILERMRDVRALLYLTEVNKCNISKWSTRRRIAIYDP